MADPKHTAPRSASEIPKRAEAQVTGTGIVAMHKDDNDTEVDKAKIAADLERERIRANTMIAVGSLVTIALIVVVGLALYYGQTAVVGVIGALFVVALAVFLGRSLTLKAPGIDATTGAPAKPEAPDAP